MPPSPCRNVRERWHPREGEGKYEVKQGRRPAGGKVVWDDHAVFGVKTVKIVIEQSCVNHVYVVIDIGVEEIPKGRVSLVVIATLK